MLLAKNSAHEPHHGRRVREDANDISAALDVFADGLTVLAEAQKRNPDVVTVLLTGYASIESAIEAIRQGVFGYILKPARLAR